MRSGIELSSMIKMLGVKRIDPSINRFTDLPAGSAGERPSLAAPRQRDLVANPDTIEACL